MRRVMILNESTGQIAATVGIEPRCVASTTVRLEQVVYPGYAYPKGICYMPESDILFVADSDSDSVRRIEWSFGGVGSLVQIAGLKEPSAVSCAPDMNRLWIASTAGHQVS